MDFQWNLRALKDQGVVLAIYSKNNLADVEELFTVRSDMPLQLSDFVAIEVNWDPKPDNLRKIASSLNIGLDSIVFIDDSPFECELIRATLPEVTTIQLPEDPAAYPRLIRETRCFDRLSVTDSDAAKTEQYPQNRQRHKLQHSVSDLTTYLQTLETRLVIRPTLPKDLSRVHQLFSKTNQFNLTTIRYPLGEIEGILGDNTRSLCVVEAGDRFGDLGLIGTYLLKLGDRHATLGSFLMSCRAMGRGIETAMMNDVKAQLRCQDISTVEARFVPTAKNKPIEDFCERQGFELVARDEQGDKHYRLDVETFQPADCHWIEVVTREEV